MDICEMVEKGGEHFENGQFWYPWCRCMFFLFLVFLVHIWIQFLPKGASCTDLRKCTNVHTFEWRKAATDRRGTMVERRKAWKSLATIFDRLVSEPPFFFIGVYHHPKGISPFFKMVETTTSRGNVFL